jgi:hypothetical protein
MKNKGIAFILILAFAATAQSAISQEAERPASPIAASAGTAVPLLIRYSGTALGDDGKPRSGAASITFLIFKEEQGGEPLWTETQSVAIDAAGRYQVQLGAGSPSGLPAVTFASGEGRWLEVEIPGQPAQPRVLLASVPFAMKAAEADTLGGLSAQSFVTQAQLAETARDLATQASPLITPAATPSGGGTTNQIPLWTSATALGNSVIAQSNGNINIGSATTPASLGVAGNISNFASGTYTNFTSTAYNSVGYEGPRIGFTRYDGTSTAPTVVKSNDTVGWFDFFGYDGGAVQRVGQFSMFADAAPTKGVVPGRFQINTANSTGVDTARLIAYSNDNIVMATHSGKVGIGTGAPAANLEVNGTAKFDGLITFASGQTFPGGGGGTITGVTTTSPLAGGASSGAVALSLNLSALETSLNSHYAQLAAANTFTKPITFATGQTFPGAGTITGVTAGTGLLGGGTTGAITVSLDTTKIPTLTSSPTFNGSAGDGAVGDTAGTVVGTAGMIGVAGTGNTSGYSGIAGVWGNASAHVGVLGTSDQYPGVAGFSNAGSGVQGYSSGSTLNTAGVFGNSGSGTGTTHVVAGVWGDSYQQVGVEGTSGQSVGVYGQSNVYFGVQGVSASGTGVSGLSTSGPGASGSSSTGAGMVGYTDGTVLNTGGVIGIAGPRTSFTGISGIWGDAANHVGVQGTSNIYTGVQGSSVSAPGVQGNSTSGNGVHGVSASTSGIFGETSSTSGADAALFGYSHNSATGVYGFSSQIGIHGVSGGASSTGAESSVFVNGPPAIWGDGGAYAVVGTTDGGVAGEFINTSSSQSTMYVGNFYNGNSNVAEFTGEAGGCSFFGNGDVLCDGTVSAAIKVDGGARAVKTFSVQSAESWYEDAGSGQLVEGVAHVELEPTFAQTVNAAMEYHVFLTPNGDSEGLYVTNKTAQGFDVHEQHRGHSNIAFDYRIMAKPAGPQTQRLQDVTERMQKQAEMRTRMHQSKNDGASSAASNPAGIALDGN